ncbi:MAG: deoxyribodipyrimidine photo-lyase/cryptochrome family protein [Acidobacteriota bacterium]
MFQVVWFKRDLRIRDHRPLAEAARRGPVLPLYLIEPELLSAPDFDPSHWAFVEASLRELDHHLRLLGQGLVVRTGEAVEVLRSLPIAHLWAHEETGNFISYQRDRRVRRWARETQTPFTEFPSGGVVRRLPSRDGWAKNWEKRMNEPIVEAPGRLQPSISPTAIPTARDLALPPSRRFAQPGGESAAQDTLDSFLSARGRRYHLEMSSPVTAGESCSRLSSYLAYDNLSTRQVLQATRARLLTLNEPDAALWRRALRAFDARLHWRCHFMQKLEDEPRIEFENFVPAYDGLREPYWNEDWFAAWAEGRTGYPFLDACMRMLEQTGWINFRMRAMLVSFASYHLWLHWRRPALHLAKLFVDYEPGIHYSQIQMQSGTTGINTLRIYSPIKQQQDQDPDGDFVRRWLPPGPGYPNEPIVGHKEALALARSRMSAVRRAPAARAQALAVAERHGSRKKTPRPVRRSPQQMLF